MESATDSAYGLYRYYLSKCLFVQPKWPERLVVIRHAQSDLNVARDEVENGQQDSLEKMSAISDRKIGITKLGEYQTNETGKYLANLPYKFDIIYSSPYNRTMQTSGIIKSWLPYYVDIKKDSRLREKEFGYMHALSKEEIKEKFPLIHAARQRDGKYWHRLWGGDHYPDVEDRMRLFLRTLNDDWYGKYVAIITHQVPCKIIRSLFEHMDEDQVMALDDVPNCGISEYVLDRSKKLEGRLKLNKWNHVAYDPDINI